jgi:hypothetical protein
VERWQRIILFFVGIAWTTFVLVEGRNMDPWLVIFLAGVLGVPIFWPSRRHNGSNGDSTNGAARSGGDHSSSTPPSGSGLLFSLLSLVAGEA